MIEQRATVRWSNGLHMRPATTLIQALKPFQAKVTISAGDKSADARSVMRLMSLGAVQGTELLIQADGPDESAALSAVLETLAQDLA